MLRVINRAHGIPKENIAINCSYKHNAVWADGDEWKKGKQVSTVDDAKITCDEWWGVSANEFNLNPDSQWFYGHIGAVLKRAAD